MFHGGSASPKTMAKESPKLAFIWRAASVANVEDNAFHLAAVFGFDLLTSYRNEDETTFAVSNLNIDGLTRAA